MQARSTGNCSQNGPLKSINFLINHGFAYELNEGLLWENNQALSLVFFQIFFAIGIPNVSLALFWLYLFTFNTV